MPRQISLRSKTFSQNKLQQDFLKRSATPDKLTSDIDISNNNNINAKRGGKKHSTTKSFTKQL